MIIVFTGDGKGKTSAALGVAMRSSGWGNRVAIVQFIKGNKEIGEWQAIQKIDNIEIFQFLDDTKLYISLPEEKHKNTITNILDKIKEISESKQFKLIILDEVNNAIKHGLVRANEIIKILKSYPEIDFILTGRDASAEIIRLADLVTEMKKIKHPFDSKIPAQKGIDY